MPGPMDKRESNMEVREVVSANGWNWSKISFELPLNIKLEIQATPYAIAARSEDRLSWAANSHGNFDLNSVYKLATSRSDNLEFEGDWIWKIKILPRIQFFVWKCFHNSIGVKGCRPSRGVNSDLFCPRCRDELETIIHLLRDCGDSKDLWKQLGISEMDKNFFTCDLHTWLTVNAWKEQLNCHSKPPWNIVFLFAIWMLWKQRNSVIFHNRDPNPNLATHIISQVSDFYWCAAEWKKANIFTMKNIRWERPSSGWRKLNMDGSSLGNPGIAGGGGVIREEAGNWVVGFSRKIGVTSSFDAELWALRDGLTICVNKNFQSVEVELDAKAIIDVLKNPNRTNLNPFSPSG